MNQNMYRYWLPAALLLALTTSHFSSADPPTPAFLESLIPQASKLEGLVPHWMGANCFNTVLFIKGFSPGLRFSTGDEWAYYLESPFCRQVEKPQPGDLGRIRAPDLKEVHGFIYVSENWVFQKLAEDVFREFPIGLQPRSSMDVYKYPRSEASVPEAEKKQNQLIYYRCDSFVQSAPSASTEAFDAFQKELGEFLFDPEVDVGFKDDAHSPRGKAFLRRAKRLSEKLEVYASQLRSEREENTFLQIRRNLQVQAVISQLWKMEEELRRFNDAFEASIKSVRKRLREIEAL